MSETPKTSSIRELLAIVAEPETPEQRDEEWNSIEEQFDALRSAAQAVADAQWTRLDAYNDVPGEPNPIVRLRMLLVPNPSSGALSTAGSMSAPEASSPATSSDEDRVSRAILALDAAFARSSELSTEDIARTVLNTTNPASTPKEDA